MNRNKFFVSVILAIVLTYFFIKSNFVKTVDFFFDMNGGYAKAIFLIFIFAVVVYILYSLFEKKEQTSLNPLLGKTNDEPKDNGVLGI